MNVLTVVLRSAEEPVLSRVQMHRLARAHRAHAVYLKHRESLVDSDDDDGPQDEDAWLLEDLKVLTHLYSRLRDREQLIALIFEVRRPCIFSPRVLKSVRFSGVYCRSLEGHYNHFLLPIGAGISCCEYRGLFERSAKLCQ